jgi:hypothetical protein
VRNDTRIRHPDAKRILAFLDIAGIHARKGDSNPNLACAWLRVVHVANEQHIPRSALLLVPSGFHGFLLSDARDLIRSRSTVVVIPSYLDCIVESGALIVCVFLSI